MNDVVTHEKAASAQVSRDLAVINQGSAAVPMPANFEQMTKFASLMAQGGSMVGLAFRDNPGACLGALIQAMRWGMDPYACSQKMYIASKTGDGPIAYEAQLVHAVLLKNAPLTRRPRIAFEGDGDNRTCVVTFHVIGDDEPITYRSPAISKVRKPRDKGSPLWHDNPDQQLAYYTIRAAARLHFPDVIMGVYTPDEVEQVAAVQAAEMKTFTLGGDPVVEAEFSDGTAVLAKHAEKTKAAKEPKQRKGAVPKDDPKATGLEGVSSEGARDDTATQDASAEKPNEPEAETETVEESDEQIVARVSAEVRAAPANSKSQPIRDARGALTRIAQMSDDRKLAAKAEQILNLYDLD